MTDKKDDKYKAFKKEVDPHFSTINKYMAKIRDVHNTAIKEANEAIDYQFEKMDDGKIRDTYKATVVNRLKDVKDKLKISAKDKLLEQTLLESLGVISEKEIDKILKSRGADYQPDHLISELNNSASRFSQTHYGSIANKYGISKEGKEHAVKFLGLENKVDVNAITNQDLTQLFSIYGSAKEIHGSQVPTHARLAKKDKKKDKK